MIWKSDLRTFPEQITAFSVLMLLVIAALAKYSALRPNSFAATHSPPPVPTAKSPNGMAANPCGARQSAVAHHPPQHLSLFATTSTKEVRKRSVVSGRVLTAAGNAPIVAIVWADTVVPSSHSKFTRYVFTNGQGVYNLLLPAGDYEVSAKTPTRRGRHAAFDVGPDQAITGIDVVIRDPVSVEVDVLLPSGAGAPSAHVSLFSRTTRESTDGVTDASGKLVLKVTPGAYELRVWAPPIGRPEQTVRLTEQVTSSPRQRVMVKLK